MFILAIKGLQKQLIFTQSEIYVANRSNFVLLTCLQSFCILIPNRITNLMWFWPCIPVNMWK